MALPQKAVAFYLQSCYSDRDNINGGSTMFRKKRFAAGKKAALSVSYDTANQKINVTVQNGFRAVLNGVDFPQIVGKDGTVHPPLTAQTVLLSFRLTGPDGVERVTGDYPIRIPGLHSGKPAHPKPSVIPELAQWHSADNGWFIPSAHSSIVLPPMRERPSVPLRRNFSRITGRSLAQSCPCVMTIRRRRATFI